MNKDILTRPFEAHQIKQRPGQQGKTLSYVETHAVIARLNEGCESWDFIVDKYEVREDEVVVLGRLVVEGTVTKTAFGGSSITRDRDGNPVSIADDLKSAASDCLKKTASLLGVGLELYGGGPSQAEPANVNGSSQVQQMPQQVDRLTAKQLAAIHGAARRANMSRVQLVELVHRAGKNQLEALTKREASDLISELTGSNGSGRS